MVQAKYPVPAIAEIYVNRQSHLKTRNLRFLTGGGESSTLGADASSAYALRKVRCRLVRGLIELLLRLVLDSTRHDGVVEKGRDSGAVDDLDALATTGNRMTARDAILVLSIGVNEAATLGSAKITRRSSSWPKRRRIW